MFDAPVNEIAVTEECVAFLCGDGKIRTISNDLHESEIGPHHGAILSAAAVDDRLLTGGDDGRLMLTAPGSATEVLFERRNSWVHSVAASRSGSIAWAAGRMCYQRSASGKAAALECPHTPASLAFDPRGRRLAIALYGGAWLWLPKAEKDLVRQLQWKGSHLVVIWSPDGKYVITSMQERELHGWRLSDGANMRMSGYPGKIHSLSWNNAGTRLATSGAPVAILWPFDRDGPWNRQPEEVGFLPAGIQRLAWHPTVDVLALGCARGEIELVRLADQSRKTLRVAENHAVTAMAWSRSGKWLAAGTAGGAAEIYSFETR